MAALTNVRSMEARHHIELVASADLDAATIGGLRDLWAAAFGDFSSEDADHAFGGCHAIARAEGRVLAHASVVPRRITVGERTFAAGYVEAVATLPACQGRGLGTSVMRELDTVIRGRYDLGALSTGRPRFYERLGWERWRGASYVRLEGTRRRTPDEDDGLMVLRFGTSSDLPLTAPIMCDDRPGDAW